MIGSNVKTLQVNLNRSAQATESALQAAIDLKVDFIVVQEPWVAPRNQDHNSTRSTTHQSFTQILPPRQWTAS
jgi:hypothetical protein